MSKRNRNPVRNSLVDIALLTCGLVDLPVFRDCVSAIKREMQTIDCQFHIILNGLAPEARESFNQIIQTIPNPRMKHSSERLGFSAGANRIIRQGTSPLVLFITDDVILHEGTLRKLVQTMDDPTIGLCGLKLIFPEDSTDPTHPAGRVQHIGHGIDIRGEVTHPLIGWFPANPKCNVSRELQSVTGGVFMVRRNTFLRAGGFWEGYGIGYFEDVELCLTIRQIPNGKEGNYKVWINTEATATHITNASMLKSEQPPTFDTNRFVFQKRNGGRMTNDNWTFW